MCLSLHPRSPMTQEGVLEPARGNAGNARRYHRGPSSVTGFRVGCQKFDLYKFGKCGITLA